MNSIVMNQPQSFKGAVIVPQNIKFTPHVLTKMSNHGTSDIWMVPISNADPKDLTKKMLVMFGKNDNRIFDFFKGIPSFDPVEVTLPKINNLKILKPGESYRSILSNTAQRIITLLPFKNTTPIQQVNSQRELDMFVRKEANLADNKLSSISINEALFF